MKCRYLISAMLLVLAGTGANARAPFIRFGLEWGPSAVIYSSEHLNYLDSDGSRIYDNKSSFGFFPNGFIMGHAGVNATNFLAFSIHSGYMGVNRNNHMIPVLLRMTVAPSGFDADGIFIFADAGVGFHLSRVDQPDRRPAILADAGAGYRFALTPTSNLEFALNLKVAADNILIPDPDRGGYIPRENISKDTANSLSLCLSVGFSF